MTNRSKIVHISAYVRTSPGMVHVQRLHPDTWVRRIRNYRVSAWSLGRLARLIREDRGPKGPLVEPWPDGWTVSLPYNYPVDWNLKREIPSNRGFTSIHVR